MQKVAGPGAPASAAEAGVEACEQELDTKPGLLGQAARVFPHPTPLIIPGAAGEQKTTFNGNVLAIGVLAPDPVLDPAYRTGIVPPAQRVRTTMADIEIVVTVFPDRHALSKTEMIMSLGFLSERIRTTRAPQKESLPLLKLARLGDGRTGKGCVRFNANILAISGVETDYDGEQVGIDRAIEIATSASLLCIIYTSPSHTLEKPRFRILAEKISTCLEAAAARQARAGRPALTRRPDRNHRSRLPNRGVKAQRNLLRPPAPPYGRNSRALLFLRLNNAEGCGA
jgi:hypothetical protein